MCLNRSAQKVASAWSRANFPPRELDALFRGVEAVYKANRALNSVRGLELQPCPFFATKTWIFLQKLKEIGPNPSDPKALGDLLMRWVKLPTHPMVNVLTRPI